ncbi:MAG TPA: hypothetical protein VIK62_00715 [Verrucomicrobiae bacterium]
MKKVINNKKQKTIPLEIYTDERVAEFERNNEKALVKFRFKK